MFKFESLRLVTESGVTVQADDSSSSNPKKTTSYLNREHFLNRVLVTNLLAEYVHSGKSVLKPIKCLDAMGSSGVSGLIWKKHLGSDVDVIINDPSKSAAEVIRENASSNQLEVTVLNKDPCILLHETGFNFIFLDCYSDASSFLDAAFRNVARNGIVVITTKDDCSLQGSNPEVALRRYGGRVTRTCYYYELGIRLVIAALAKAAAKYNKAITVLLSVAFKSSFTVGVMVHKGPLQAYYCLQNIRMLSHCMVCEDRAFHPVDTGFPVDVKNLLKSSCLQGEHVVQILGPLWAANIFDTHFIEGVLTHSVINDQSAEVLLKLILEEAKCSSKTSTSPGSEDLTNKRIKLELESPAFYFNLHKHHPKVPHQKSVSKVIEELKRLGFRASKTHFDRLAVRTNAPLDKLYEIMQGSDNHFTEGEN